jgi:type IV pilus assembly protein PilN
MTRINLLPWREMRRRQISVQILRGSLLAWALMGLVVLFAHLHMNGLIQQQQERNQYLKDEIAKLDDQIKKIRDIEEKKRALLARMEVIQRLQADRTQIVHVFDDLVHKLPEGMYLTSIEKRDKNITLKGVAQSNARISAFMRSLDSSEWFANANLDVINVARQQGGAVSQFTLRVNQTNKLVDASAEAGSGG